MQRLVLYFLFLQSCCGVYAGDPEVLRIALSDGGKMVFLVHRYAIVPKHGPKLYVELDGILTEVRSRDIFIIGSQTGLKSVIYEFTMETKNRGFITEKSGVGTQLHTILTWEEDGAEVRAEKDLRIVRVDTPVHRKGTK